MRPDLNDYLLKYGHEEEGRKGYFNQWVIDSLVEDDVVVVDMFDKIFQGTYVGGNLSTAIKTRHRAAAPSSGAASQTWNRSLRSTASMSTTVALIPPVSAT